MIIVNKPLSIFRATFNILMTVLSCIFTILALIPIISILSTIIIHGLPKFNWDLFISLPAPVGLIEEKNGFGHAILGSLIMVSIGAFISVPLGILNGIFLSEFSQFSVIINIVRFITNIFASIPSILAGFFIYKTLVMVSTFSALAGGLALSLTMLPVIAINTEEALKNVPISYRLGSAALGANNFSTIFYLIIPSALPSIITGILLAIARAAGETAPLIFTALSTSFWPTNLFSPSPSLTILIYEYATVPFKERNDLAWAASCVLIMFILLLSIILRIIASKFYFRK